MATCTWTSRLGSHQQNAHIVGQGQLIGRPIEIMLNRFKGFHRRFVPAVIRLEKYRETVDNKAVRSHAQGTLVTNKSNSAPDGGCMHYDACRKLVRNST